MLVRRVWALAVFTVLLGACGDDADRRSESMPDGATSALPDAGDGSAAVDLRDGSMDATTSDLDGALGGDAATTADAASGSLGDGSTHFPVNEVGQVLCGTAPCQCSDGLDNDQNGLIDLADPECVSPWDNDESTFATGISGDNRDEACQDCFFDGNSGAGDDGCRVATSCLSDPNDSSSGRGNCNTCQATDQCRNFCQAYTPNGCDCFGCCTVNLGSNITKNVQLGTGCDIDGTTLSPGCVECAPSTSCRNECGRCELCPGKTAADLPADCGSTTPGDGGVDGGVSDAGDGTGDASTPTPTCDLGEQRCGEGLPACELGTACSFGCCIFTPFL